MANKQPVLPLSTLASFLLSALAQIVRPCRDRPWTILTPTWTPELHFLSISYLCPLHEDADHVPLVQRAGENLPACSGGKLWIEF